VGMGFLVSLSLLGQYLILFMKMKSISMALLALGFSVAVLPAETAEKEAAPAQEEAAVQGTTAYLVQMKAAG